MSNKIYYFMSDLFLSRINDTYFDELHNFVELKLKRKLNFSCNCWNFHFCIMYGTFYISITNCVLSRIVVFKFYIIVTPNLILIFVHQLDRSKRRTNIFLLKSFKCDWIYTTQKHSSHVKHYDILTKTFSLRPFNFS